MYGTLFKPSREVIKPLTDVQVYMVKAFPV